jgi:hypothetical protein
MKFGATDYNIISHVKKASLPLKCQPGRYESMGKIWDYKMATFHNAQEQHQAKLQQSPGVFRKKEGVFGQYQKDFN